MARRSNLRLLRWRWPVRLALFAFVFASFAVPLLASPLSTGAPAIPAAHTQHAAEPDRPGHHDHGATADSELPAELPSDLGCNLCALCGLCIVAIAAPMTAAAPPLRAVNVTPAPAPHATGLSPAPLPEPPRT